MKNPIIKNILISILILALYLSIYSGLGRLTSFIPYNENYVYLIEIIVYIIMTILLLITLKIIKKTDILKFNSKSFIKGLIVGGFAVFFINFCFLDEFEIGLKSGSKFLPFIEILLFSISVIVGTGFTEELLCRGIIQNLMFDAFGHNTSKGIHLSVIISSILFGVAHFINYFNLEVSFEGVLTQVIVATLIGLYFGAIYARCHSIWALAFLHGMFDFVQMIGEGFWGNGFTSDIINTYHLKQVFIPTLLYGFLFLFLLRKKKITECYLLEKKETT